MPFRFRSQRGVPRLSDGDLEAMIDHYGLLSVLEDISVVCWEKAEHIRTNWQDDKLARAWEEAGVVVDKATGDKNVEAVS